MPRPPRIDVPGLPQHVVARGHDRRPCFFGDDYCQTFLRLVAQACLPTETEVHAYVLMTNHVHLLLTGRRPGSISRFMHSVGRRYSWHVNHSRERTGALFESRFKSSLIQSELYFLRCMRYVESNPVRAGMVLSPADYAWSSHAQNACGEPSGFLKPHPEYLRLGHDRITRAQAYRALFLHPQSDEELAAIRTNIGRERVLGSEDFLHRLSTSLGREAGVVEKGRPPKQEKINLVPF